MVNKKAPAMKYQEQRSREEAASPQAYPMFSPAEEEEEQEEDQMETAPPLANCSWELEKPRQARGLPRGGLTSRESTDANKSSAALQLQGQVVQGSTQAAGAAQEQARPPWEEPGFQRMLEDPANQSIIQALRWAVRRIKYLERKLGVPPHPDQPPVLEYFAK